ncbi:MAG: hypothetical protein JNN08_32905 [Bryobacterales bacterium]|nr:hypothetical protein [Bryobacterales bacterium]
MRLWRTVLWVAVAIAVIRGWILPLGDSFWVDETVTYWTIKDGWSQFWERTSVHQDSRAYCALLWAWAQVAGMSEVALRLPSLLSIAGALGVAAWMLRQRFGPGTGWPVWALASVYPQLQFYGGDARPYALAFLTYALATLALVWLHEQPSAGRALVWAVAAGFTVWVQPVTAVGLVAHAVWVVGIEGKALLDWRRTGAYLFGALVAGGMAWLEFLRITSFYGRNDARMLNPTPMIVRYLVLAMPPAPLLPLVVAVLLAVPLGLWRRQVQRHRFGLLWLAVCTVLAGPLMMTLLRWLSGMGLLVDRYVITMYWGWLLLTGIVIARWMDARGRLIFTTLFVVFGLSAQVVKTGWMGRHAEADWRAALSKVREWDAGRRLPVHLQSGLVEGRFDKFLNDPTWKDFLLAPTAVYPVPGERFILPFDYRASHPMPARGPLIVVAYEDGPGPSVYVTSYGDRAQKLGQYRRLAVYAVDAQ